MTTHPQDGPQVHVVEDSQTAFVSNNASVEGFARGFVEAVLGAAIVGAIAFFEAGPDVPQSMVLLVPTIIVVLRTIEGVIDKSRE